MFMKFFYDCVPISFFVKVYVLFIKVCISVQKYTLPSTEKKRRKYNDKIKQKTTTTTTTLTQNRLKKDFFFRVEGHKIRRSRIGYRI